MTPEKNADTNLTAFAVNCSLRSSGAEEPSSSDKLIDDLIKAMTPHGVTGDRIRTADYDILPGVSSDQGTGDQWPGIRQHILQADIFIPATPIWLGQPSSIAKRVLETSDS